MKLQYQLNVAFTILLFIIMTVSAYVIYSLILDLLIKDEQRQLEQKGEILINVLNDQFGFRTDIQAFNNFLQEQNLQLFLYDRHNDSVLLSTLPSQMVQGFYHYNDFSDENIKLWELGNDKYVNSRILFYPETTGLELILLTPMKDLQKVQHNFFIRMLIVFLIGATVAVFLSYLLTNKLVTPLTRLKNQLKKIEKRKFNEIEPIQASGEIKEVAQSVYDMANELQRYIDTQQNFFQNASHELKTPLMTIQGYAEGIKEKVFDEVETEKGLDVMVMEVKRLKKIINEMIFLAKLDSEKEAYQAEEVNVAAIFNKVVDRLLPLVNEKDIELHYESEPNLKVFVDEEKLLRALLNLTVNGVRYAHSKLQIRAISNGKETIITIEDDGSGITDDLLPHIFHRFVKGKNGETGLGLAIARAIIEQSGGKISVGKSELGGAKFTISL